MQFSQQSPPSTTPPSAEELHYLGYHKQMALNNWLIHPALNQFVSTTLAKPSQAAPGRGESLSPVLRFHPSGNDLSIQTQFPLPASLSDLLLQETICQNNEQCPLESITSISYFEVTILSKPDPSVVFAIGLATRPYPHFRLPGWNIYSVGYHSDDGRKYVDDGYGGRNYSSSFGVGDVVGCGYDRTSGNVFFTLNGTNLGIARQGMWHLVFPTLGADGNVDVQVNFGDLPFKYQAPLGVNPQPYTPETYSMPSGPSGSTQAPIQPSANIPPKADYTPDVKMPDPKDY
ncbi:hypothetical protein K7432_014967 [Basidiobolus ranarum]|uniref:B30.2/SPRY domain-containing protein n=1 Tax=Basidiobolus ranarum TaxID=34480 RepID=A0ABR2WGR6_9FUNG